MKPFDLIGMAQSAERILVPKSKDAVSGVTAFSEVTGIEIPSAVWEKEYVTSAGRSFRLVPGADMPGQIVAGWGDIAICSTELVAEAGLKAVESRRIGAPVCRYSVLALEERADDWQEFLGRSSRYPVLPRQLPGSFPNFLGMIAAGRDLPLLPLGVPISGKGEATMRASGIGAVADRVVSGNTAKKLGGREVFKLADIYPELVMRAVDAVSYERSRA